MNGNKLFTGITLNSDILLIASLAVAFFAILLSVWLFFLLFRVQRKLRSAFSAKITSRSYDLNFFLKHIQKEKSILGLNAANREIISSSELTQVLGEIVSLAYQIFKCRYIELSLVDSETEIYHSSCSAGKPVKGHELGSDFIQEIKSIHFSGKRFGYLRLVISKKKTLTTEEKGLLDMLAMQAAIAVLNSRYTEELLRLQSQSEESVKAKTGFLANLSHEIRGPLGIMLNAVELVLTEVCGEINPQQEKTLSMVKKNGDHLLDLVNDVLDYAKVEAGKIIPDKQAVNVKEIVSDIAKLVNSQAQKKKHKLNFEVKGDNLFILCDRRHIRQILINFLTNAVKYTPESGEIKFWAEMAAPGKIKISVKDNGVGIPSEQHARVFAAFDRLDNKYSNEQGGTGLGLPLTAKLTEANRGKIGFDSEAEKGSTFWVVFDATSAPVALKSEQKDAPVPKGYQQRILLLEPNQEEGSVLERYLSSLSYNVTMATALVLDQKFDLAIVENTFLDDSQGNIITELRNNSSTDLPIILLSSRAFDFDTEHYLKMGVDICLSKPLEMAEVARKVGSLLS